MVDPAFALCQTMPLSEFADIADELTQYNYRLSRVRPYDARGEVRVAAVWARDGRPARFAYHLSSEEVMRQDAEMRKQKYLPIDVAGYIKEGKLAHSVVWLNLVKPNDAQRISVEVPMPYGKSADWRNFRKEGLGVLTSQSVFSRDGKQAWANAIWARVPQWCSITARRTITNGWQTRSSRQSFK